MLVAATLQYNQKPASDFLCYIYIEDDPGQYTQW